MPVDRTEPRGIAGAVATRVKFQRGYEGHALDDVIVEAVNAAGAPIALEIQAKRTLNFTASDGAFGKLVRQIASASVDAAERPIAAGIARTSAKIERHYLQLLVVARKMGSGTALRQALDAPRVASAGMRDFAAAFATQLHAAGANSDDEALWRVLRRFQILVFDFESPGAVSNLLALTLARLALPPATRERAADLWSALQEKALSYDADGGELDRIELIRWLRDERGFELAPSRNIVRVRQRLADHSQAALDAIEDRIAGVPLDRTDRVDQLAAALEGGRYLEIVGASGVGKSALLKALIAELRPEAFPLVLSPARTPGGGWLALSRDLGFGASAQEFLSELAASGATILFVDSLDRITDPAVQATVTDLLTAAARTPDIRVVATVGPDFDDDQRRWLPSAALDLMGSARVTVGPLSDAEAAALAQADGRLAQLLANVDAQPLTRNLCHLRQLLRRAGDGVLPLTEAALAQTWWEAGPALPRVQRRDRVRALRELAAQVLAQAAQLDVAGIESPVVEDLLRGDDLDELIAGATAAFKQDVLRDWAAANMLRETPARLDDLPLAELAPVTLARAVELFGRMLIEGDPTGGAWGTLVGQLRAGGVHPSWLRLALLALVRSEQGIQALDRAFGTLIADRGVLLQALIRQTIGADSESAVEWLAAAGLPRELIPEGFRTPTGLSWARLMVWLLQRIDDLEVPVGRDIFHFFSVWLMANPGQNPCRLPIVQRLYEWLMVLEGRVAPGASPSNFRQLFAYDRREGHSRGLVGEVRVLFLAYCDQSPDLAAAYLTAHMTPNEYYDVVGDILKLSQASAKAAPAALAAFVVEALIEAEKRHREETYQRDYGRLQYHTDAWITPGPAQGPFLALLRSEAVVGLRLVRRIVEYGLGLDDIDRARLSGFTLDLAYGPLRVIGPGSYFLSRDLGAAPIVTSALRALEAWGHEQVDGGRSVEDVMRDILGETDTPAAILAVAVDVLLSHTTGPDPRLMPFATSPELLELDWDRFTRDRAGIGKLENPEPPAAPGATTNAGLRARASRKTALSWAISAFLLEGDAKTLEQVRDALRRGQTRLDQQSPAVDATARGPRWQVDHALRVLEPANWRRVRVEQPDGKPAFYFQYVEPAEEAAILDPLRTESNAGASETLLIFSLVDAVLEPDRRTSELLDRGLAWAQAELWTELREDDEDFDKSQRWRAVVATAVLTVLAPERTDAQTWARSVLQRALQIDTPDRAHQVRFHALAIAALGWAALVSSRDTEARAHVLALAGRDTETVIAALGGEFNALAAANPRLPKALLRVGLTAAIHPERDWDNVTRTARRRTQRKRRLKAAIAAEAAWLDGGIEPPWPRLPQARRLAKRRGVRLPGLAAVAADPDEIVPAAKPDMWFNDHSGGDWLGAAERAAEVRDSAWVADFVATYRDFSDAAWGLGLSSDAELRDLPTRWLHPFDRLRVRAASGLDTSGFGAAVLAPLAALPDRSFLKASEEVVNVLDCLFWDEKRLPIEHLVIGRAQIITRLIACRLWQWRRDERVDTIASDLVGPIQSLYLHVRRPFGSGRCYLPLDGAAFAPVFPALVDLTRDAPGLSYVASHFLSLAERGQAWAPLDLVLSAALGWADSRPVDAEFWRDGAFGRRLCSLFLGQIERIHEAGPELIAQTRHLVERLISAGVPEALPLEQRLAALS